MKRIIHGVEIDTDKKSISFKHAVFDEMDIYRLQVAIKIMNLYEYLQENFINADEQLYLVAVETREVIVGADANYSDDEAIDIACERLGVVLIAKDNVEALDVVLESAS